MDRSGDGQDVAEFRRRAGRRRRRRRRSRRRTRRRRHVLSRRSAHHASSMGPCRLDLLLFRKLSGTGNRPPAPTSRSVPNRYLDHYQQRAAASLPHRYCVIYCSRASPTSDDVSPRAAAARHDGWTACLVRSAGVVSPSRDDERSRSENSGSLIGDVSGGRWWSWWWIGGVVGGSGGSGGVEFAVRGVAPCETRIRNGIGARFEGGWIFQEMMMMACNSAAPLSCLAFFFAFIFRRWMWVCLSPSPAP